MLGYPAYSGAFPSPMVTNALITTREAAIAGKAVWSIHEAKQNLLRQPFLPPSAIVDWMPRSKVAGLQTSVRSALIEMELLKNLSYAYDAKGKNVELTAGGISLVKVHCPDKTVFDKQLSLVESFSALRAERTAEILTQVVPQTSHWSSIAALSPDRHRYTWELIGIGLRFAMMIVMRFKYDFNVKRAWQRSAVIQPMILTPGHAAYPSGHATEAAFVAEFLPLLMGDPSHPFSNEYPSRDDDNIIIGMEKHAGEEYGMARQLNRLALRVAENRVVAGLHYPIDTIAGQALGCMLARYMVWLTGDQPAPWLQMKALPVGAIAFSSAVTGHDDRPGSDSFVHEQHGIEKDSVKQPLPAAPKNEAIVLRDLWVLARREWVNS